jgi:hypothetical protein
VVGCSAVAVGTGRRTANEGTRSAVARGWAAWAASVGARGGEGVVELARGWPETGGRRSGSASAPADGAVGGWGPARRGRSSGRFYRERASRARRRAARAVHDDRRAAAVLRRAGGVRRRDALGHG